MAERQRFRELDTEKAYSIEGPKIEDFKGFNKLKLRDGENRIRILPMPVLANEYDYDASTLDDVFKPFGLFLWRSFTGNRVLYACNTFDKSIRNPIREKYDAVWKDGMKRYGDDKDAIKRMPEYSAYRGTRRCLIYVLDCHPKATEEERNTVQVWDAPAASVEDILKVATDSEGRKFSFWNPDKCSEISFIKEGERDRTRCSAFRVSRPEDRITTRIPDSILDQLVPIDEVIHIPTVEEALDAIKAQEALFADGPPVVDTPPAYTRSTSSASNYRPAPQRVDEFDDGETNEVGGDTNDADSLVNNLLSTPRNSPTVSTRRRN